MIFLIEFFKAPPDRLHEVFVHGFVTLFEVHPSTNAADDDFPSSVKLSDRGSAGVVEVGDTESLDATLTVLDTQILLYHVLDWQTVTVPTPLTLHAEAFHGPETRNDVLGDRTEDRTVVRGTGNKRRAVVKDVRLVAGPLGNRALEGMNTIPEIQDTFFQVDDIVSLRKLELQHRGIIAHCIRERSLEIFSERGRYQPFFLVFIH